MRGIRMGNQRTIYRIGSALLVLALVLVLLPVTAQAASREEARDAILAAYTNHTGKVDLKPYNLTVQELEEIFFELYNSGQLPWYASRSYTYFYDGDQATAIEPKYLDEVQYDRATYERKVAEILDKTVKPGMSQLQIALAIHDYLCAFGFYDETYTLYRGYELLVGGSAVCQGYAEAYMDLLQRAGLECLLIQSTPMDHCWNLVKLDGNWYHVDATWDDPITDVEGRIQHNNFMLSDGGIALAGTNGHNSWETSIICSATNFDTAWWSDVYSAIWYENASTCYLRRTDGTVHSIIRRDEQTGTETVLHSFDAGYLNIGGGELHYFHHGLTLSENRLYFNSMDTVWSMNPDGGDLKVEYTYDTAANQKVILGSHVEGNMIHLTLRDSGDGQTRIEVPLANPPAHTHSYSSIVTEATCLAEGYTTYTCACGDSYTDNPTPLADHSYDSGIVMKDPTPTETGRIVYTCIHCGYSYGEDLFYTPPAATTPPAGTTPPAATIPTQLATQIADAAAEHAEDIFIAFCLLLSLLLLPGVRRKKNK